MSSGHNNMVERREFLKGLGVAAGGALTIGATGMVAGIPEAAAQGRAPAAGAEASSEPQLVQDTGRVAASKEGDELLSPELRNFLGPVTAGSQLGRWTVVALHPIRNGALPVTLSDASGETFQVDVLRRDIASDGVNGIATTQGLSVFLLNGGDGSVSTHEEWGLGAMSLAAALRERELEAQTPALLTWRERAARFPRGAFRVG